MLEYKFVVNRNIPTVEYGVNELAAEGWELHSVSSDPYLTTAVMQREKQEEPKPFPRPSVPNIPE